MTTMDTTVIIGLMEYDHRPYLLPPFSLPHWLVWAILLIWSLPRLTGNMARQMSDSLDRVTYGLRWELKTWGWRLGLLFGNVLCPTRLFVYIPG